MQNGAYANILGELKENIVIRSTEDGVIYGLIFLAAISKQWPQDDNVTPNYIPVLLRGVDIIKAHGASLIKGEEVWLVGEFEPAQNSYTAFREFGLGDVNGVIISLHDKTRLRIITHDPAFRQAC